MEMLLSAHISLYLGRKEENSGLADNVQFVLLHILLTEGRGRHTTAMSRRGLIFGEFENIFKKKLGKNLTSNDKKNNFFVYRSAKNIVFFDCMSAGV